MSTQEGMYCYVTFYTTCGGEMWANIHSLPRLCLIQVITLEWLNLIYQLYNLFMSWSCDLLCSFHAAYQYLYACTLWRQVTSIIECVIGRDILLWAQLQFSYVQVYSNCCKSKKACRITSTVIAILITILFVPLLSVIGSLAVVPLGYIFVYCIIPLHLYRAA